MKKVTILPDAGPANPFQYQLIHLLEQYHFQVTTAPSKRLFPIVRAVRQHDPDILYFDWLQSFFLNRSLPITLIRSVLFVIEILIVRYLYHIPIVHTLHNLQNHAGVWVSIEKRINQFFLPRCRYIRVYSETTKEKIVGLYKLKPERIQVIQDVPFHFHYPNTITQLQARQQLNLPPNAFVYAFLGAIKSYKGLENLIRSFKEMATESDYLLITGLSNVPSYTELLNNLIHNHPRIVFLPHFIEEEEVQYFMNAANVMVLPFQNVEHSGSVDLCMSFKKAIITLKTPFLAELLDHQATLLFKQPVELAQVMLNAKALPLEKMGEDNFRKADTTNYTKLIELFIAPQPEAV